MAVPFNHSACVHGLWQTSPLSLIHYKSCQRRLNGFTVMSQASRSRLNISTFFQSIQNNNTCFLAAPLGLNVKENFNLVISNDYSL